MRGSRPLLCACTNVGRRLVRPTPVIDGALLVGNALLFDGTTPPAPAAIIGNDDGPFADTSVISLAPFGLNGSR
jgi:hypothetical protein